jgi:hypothetical protein
LIRLLLPAIQIQKVLEASTSSRRKSALDTIPTKLDDAFGITIDRIKEQLKEKAEQAMEVLKWILLAKRQLKVDELLHALSASTGGSYFDWGDLLPSRSLTEWCLGLVTIDTDTDTGTSTIRFVHKSFFEYLNVPQNLDKYFKDGHKEIAKTCLTYMSFHEKDPIKLDPRFEGIQDPLKSIAYSNTL